MANLFQTGNYQAEEVILLENDGTLPLLKSSPKIMLCETGKVTTKLDAELAVYVISRPSGEECTPADYELTEQEKQDLDALSAAYPKTVVILCTDRAVDTKVLRKHPGICAILLTKPAGNISEQMLLNILTGKTAPSGRMDAAWADSAEEHKNSFSCGYRYFDTFGVKPAYPFGFGRTYTSFSVAPSCLMISGQNIVVHASVTNMGLHHSGHEVVQVYYSAPAGKLKKTVQELAGFIQTKELMPGEEEKVAVSFPLVSMASFDEERETWVLEEGLYYIRVGNHSRNTHIAAALSVDGEVIVAKPSGGLPLDTTISRMPARNLGQYTYEGETREKEEAVIIDVITSTLKNKC